jgi:hypothetical protein
MHGTAAAGGTGRGRRLVCLAAALAALGCATSLAGGDRMVFVGSVQPRRWGSAVFHGTWLVRVAWRQVVGGSGSTERQEFTSDERGRFRWVFPREPAGTLHATITVVGGPGYRDAKAAIVWPVAAWEPEITYTRAEDASRRGEKRCHGTCRALFHMLPR